MFGVPTWIVGVVVAVLTWLVIIGGITSIGRAAEKLAPLKVGLYLVGRRHRHRHVRGPGAARVLALVFREALTTRSAMGFGIFVAMRYGIARGIYANEAGYGTAAVAYGTARSTRPAEQGLQAVMEVFIVSFVTATISAMTILVSGVAEQSIAARQAGGAFVTSTAAVAGAFNAAMPTVGGWLVAFCAFLFGYTTLIGWAYYGEQFLEYMIGRRVTMPYRWIYCLLIPVRRRADARGRLGLGRPDERAADFPEPHRAGRAEWPRRAIRDRARGSGLGLAANRANLELGAVSPLDRLRGGWYDPPRVLAASRYRRQGSVARGGAVGDAGRVRGVARRRTRPRLALAHPDPHITAVRRLPPIEAGVRAVSRRCSIRVSSAALRARGIEPALHASGGGHRPRAGRRATSSSSRRRRRARRSATTCRSSHSILADPSARALYLFPTKALAQDQLAELHQLAQVVGAKAAASSASSPMTATRPRTRGARCAPARTWC